MHDLVLIKKIDASSDCWSNLVRKKKIPDLSVQEVITKYNGFEGDLVFLKQVKENEVELEEAINQYEELNKSDNCLLLHIISAPELMTLNLQKQASFLGYDVGICQGEQSIYSSIFNEILFGIVNELICFKGLLNANFLFADRSSAEKYVQTHDDMSAQGKDVEDYMDMIIYEIWKHKT